MSKVKYLETPDYEAAKPILAKDARILELVSRKKKTGSVPEQVTWQAAPVGRTPTPPQPALFVSCPYTSLACISQTLAGDLPGI